MLYRGEVMKDGRVVQAKTFASATHPNQVVKRLLSNSTSLQHPFLNILVMNDEARVWKFVAKRVGAQLRVLQESPPEDYIIAQPVIQTVFAGNMSIREAITHG